MAEDDKGSVVTHTSHLGQQWALLHTVTDKDHLPNQTGGGRLLSPPPPSILVLPGHAFRAQLQQESCQVS